MSLLRARIATMKLVRRTQLPPCLESCAQIAHKTHAICAVFEISAGVSPSESKGLSTSSLGS